MKGAVILSIIDQALISAFNLLLNLAFIAWSTPDEFGRFVVILSGAFFANSAQNALILMPLNYLLPGRPEAEANSSLSMLTSANLALTGLVLVVSLGLGALVDANAVLYLCILAHFSVMMLREYARNIMVVRGRVDKTLLNDVIYVVASAGSGALFWTLGEAVPAALGGMAAGGLASLLGGRVSTVFAPGHFRAHLREYRTVWKETRWALQGALQHEAEVRSYVFLVEHWRNAATLGMLQAGRVALSPLMLISNGWRRVARPRIVEDLILGHHQPIRKQLWFGAVVITAASVLYGLVLAAAWPLLETFVFKNRYGDMQAVVLCWWLYSCIVGLLTVPVTLLEARRQFRALAIVGFVIAFVIVASLAALLLVDFDVKSVVLVLSAIHLVELGIYTVMVSRSKPETDAALAGEHP